MALVFTAQARKCASSILSKFATKSSVDWAMGVRAYLVRWSGTDIDERFGLSWHIVYFWFSSCSHVVAFAHPENRTLICNSVADCDVTGDTYGCESGLVCGQDNCKQFHAISPATGMTDVTDCCQGTLLCMPFMLLEALG